MEVLVMARSRYLRRGHGQSVIATYAYKRYEPRMNCNNENSILRSTHNETLGTAKRKLSRARQYRLGRDTPVQPIKRREASSQVKSGNLRSDDGGWSCRAMCSRRVQGKVAERRKGLSKCNCERKQGKGDTACSAAEVQKGFEIVQCGMRSSKFSVVTSLRFLPADSDVENEKQEAPG